MTSSAAVGGACGGGTGAPSDAPPARSAKVATPATPPAADALRYGLKPREATARAIGRDGEAPASAEGGTYDTFTPPTGLWVANACAASVRVVPAATTSVRVEMRGNRVARGVLNEFAALRDELSAFTCATCSAATTSASAERGGEGKEERDESENVASEEAFPASPVVMAPSMATASDTLAVDSREAVSSCATVAARSCDWVASSVDCIAARGGDVTAPPSANDRSVTAAEGEKGARPAARISASASAAPNDDRFAVNATANDGDADATEAFAATDTNAEGG